MHGHWRRACSLEKAAARCMPKTRRMTEVFRAGKPKTRAGFARTRVMAMKSPLHAAIYTLYPPGPPPGKDKP